MSRETANDDSMRLSEEQVAGQTSAILQHTLNGVLLVDEETRIRYVNPSFLSMFHCGREELMGRFARDFVHCDCFEQAIAAGGSLTLKRTIPEHETSFRVGIFSIEDKGLYCGIFIDISEEEKARKELLDLKAQTLERAHEVIERQMRTAQEIARLLGETTAETKVLLMKLISLYKEEGA
ncbi:MAG: PAS domain-containing protein [Phycisphaerales bacterium]|nr:MAG: PAS domain-containing protein [Phycisphaerales bacterium]